VRNLWEKDRKTIFKELYRQYLEEGYSKKESKKFASLETKEVMSTNEAFIKNIFQQQEEEEC
jgi:hypothetical protein